MNKIVKSDWLKWNVTDRMEECINIAYDLLEIVSQKFSTEKQTFSIDKESEMVKL